ncbi:MAG: 4Fe-4S binding protein [Actinomycetota bacterium]|nr:4Fe-4S binding protein [Actinomycetota bacterium]
MSQKRKLVLTFSEDIVTQPITYRLVKDYDLAFNILRAEITPNMEGKILIEITGKKDNIEKGIDFLKYSGVSIQEAAKDIRVDKELCVSCGLCTSICITQALNLDNISKKLIFDKEKCILCGLCANSCPLDAIKLNI